MLLGGDDHLQGGDGKRGVPAAVAGSCHCQSSGQSASFMATVQLFDGQVLPRSVQKTCTAP
jgi:hypothetical protein